MGLSRSRPWAVAAIAVLVVLFAIDLATGPDVVVIALYGIAPLIASLGADWRSTAAVGALALLAAIASRALTHDMEPANGVVFVFTVAALGALATGGALIRTRREAAGARASVLAAASEALAGPGDLDPRLRAVEAAAGTLADRCTITLDEPRPAGARRGRRAAARARRAARHADARRPPRAGRRRPPARRRAGRSAAPRPSTARACSRRPTRPTGCSTRCSRAHRSGSRSTTATSGSCASTTTSPRSTGCPPRSRSGAR